MGVLDKLATRADEIARGRVARQQEQMRRSAPRAVPFDIAEAYRRPDPIDVPVDGPPTVRLAQATGHEDALSDAQLAGYAVQGALAGHYLIKNELKHVAAGGRS